MARDDQQTAGQLIQPVNQTSARQLLQLRVVMQQGVLQGAPGLSRTGMDDQPGRLIDYQTIVVFMHDFQRHRFGRCFHRCLEDWVDLYMLTGLHRSALIRDQRLVDTHAPVLDPSLHTTARNIDHQFGQRTIQARAGENFRNLKHSNVGTR